MGRTAAFFDLDKTVIAKSSVLAFGRAFYKGGLITRRMVAQGAFAQFRYVLRGTTSNQMEEVKNRLAALCEGWSVDQVSAIIAGSLQDRIAPIVYAEAAALIEEHRAAGRDVVIVSSAGAEVVRPIAAMLGVEHVVATELAIADGRYTGEVLTYPAGEGKVEAMVRIAEAAGYRLEDCYAYSDSITDVPMLAAVGHPTAVNPDKELRAVAAHRGWPVRDFRKPKKSGPTSRQIALGSAAVAVGVLLGWLWFGRHDDPDN
ncbi:HAD family hydrolase [Fodinicola feengrottensis]|uniref:HAD-IB family hydrolase n=1 Tax=Fodinicola feengrottensis TaxID=435914 RepID=A0ABP4RNK2_9ACTN|nr:HAD family hydrolase [Fodinicola feengrottensis]